MRFALGFLLTILASLWIALFTGSQIITVVVLVFGLALTMIVVHRLRAAAKAAEHDKFA